MSSDNFKAARLAYSIPEAATVLGCSARTIRRLVADGRLPSFKIGGAVRIPIGAVTRLINGFQAADAA